jgi:uncharacterized integral membrane protein
MSDVPSETAPDEEQSTSVAPSVDQQRQHDDERSSHRVRHTRTSAAWVAVAVAVLFGVALVDFIAQNTRDVQIHFFGADGRIPIAVALLAAALSGAVVVLAIGIGRVAQLRLNMRRERKREKLRHHKGSGQDS